MDTQLEALLRRAIAIEVYNEISNMLAELETACGVSFSENAQILEELFNSSVRGVLVVFLRDGRIEMGGL